MKKKIFKRVAVAAAFLAVSGGSQATIIDSTTNNPLNFSWSFDTGTSLLTGFGSMTLSGFNSSSLTIATSLTNTSLIAGQGGERLTAFGIGITPDATGVSLTDANDGGMVDASLSFIPSIQTIEVCAFGGVNCQGGSNGGIFGAGGNDIFSIVLAGTWGSSVDIDPIGFKYQTGYGSFEFTSSSSTSSSSTSTTTSSTGNTSTSSGGTSSTSTSSGGTSSTSTSTSSGTVAEPGTSSMALLALGLMGFALRNSRGLKQS